jgi:uncharacterized protein (UPF0371 family)
MNELNITEDNRIVAIKAAEKRQKSGNLPSACIKVGKRYIVGRKTGYLSPISSTILNALKTISRIPDEVDLISPTVLEPILEIKNKTSNFKQSYLNLGEVLIGLSICSTTNPVVQKVLENIDKLQSAELHSTHMIKDDEMITLSNLGINATSGTEIDIN